MGLGRRKRSRRLVLPRGVDWIPGKRDQGEVRLLRRFFEFLNAGFGVQHRVVADARIFRGMISEPLIRRRFDYVFK
jgi:hypothetical protein